MSPQHVQQLALHLPPEERARLAGMLLESLEAADGDDVEAAWLAEAGQRRRELADGTVETLPAETVLAQVRARLRG